MGFHQELLSLCCCYFAEHFKLGNKFYAFKFTDIAISFIPCKDLDFFGAPALCQCT